MFRNIWCAQHFHYICIHILNIFFLIEIFVYILVWYPGRGAEHKSTDQTKRSIGHNILFCVN